MVSNTMFDSPAISLSFSTENQENIFWFIDWDLRERTRTLLLNLLLNYYWSHHLFPYFIISVGVFKNGRVEIIPNDQGNRITPSYVAFTSEGERLIGDAAKNQLTSNPENTVFDAKRLIGRDWSDENVQKDIKTFPFKV